jgi:hypothetical protein
MDLQKLALHTYFALALAYAPNSLGHTNVRPYKPIQYNLWLEKVDDHVEYRHDAPQLLTRKDPFFHISLEYEYYYLLNGKKEKITATKFICSGNPNTDSTRLYKSVQEHLDFLGLSPTHAVPGTFRVLYQIDPANVIPETNENDNQLRIPVMDDDVYRKYKQKEEVKKNRPQVSPNERKKLV